MPELHVFVRSKEDGPEGAPREVTPDENGYVVVEEYDHWFVQEDRPTQLGVYIHWDGLYLPLDWHLGVNGYIWPRDPDRTWKKKQRDDLGRGQRTSGFLRFYRPDSLGRHRELKPVLYVVAGSLYENDYVGLLDRLGQLAVTEHGATTAPVEGPLPVGAAEYGAWVATPSFRQATKLVENYPLLRRSLARIVEEPAHGTHRVAQRLRVGTPQSERAPGTCTQLVRHPGKDHVLVPSLRAHYDIPENRFVVLAVERLSSEATGLAGLLRDDALSLRAERSKTLPGEVSAQNLWRQGRNTAARAADYMEQTAHQLDEICEWAASMRMQSCLRHLHPQLIHQPSLTLTRAPGYGTLYAAYRRIFGSDAGGTKLDAVRRGLAERVVRPTGELYEIWVLLETYRLLVEKFGFRPTDSRPLAHIELQMGRLELKRGRPFDLELRLKDDPSDVYHVQLTYEPPVTYSACNPRKKCFLPEYCPALKCYKAKEETYPYGPDVLITTEHRGSRKRFALDAKYRHYADQPVRREDVDKFGYNDNRTIDTLGHAKQKYLDGLQFDAAWIVQSDPSFTYFGDVPFSTAPLRERLAGLPLYAAHRYGTIYATPYRTQNLEKLLRCLLMYHAQWYYICWTCGRRLTSRTGTGHTGVYYQCDLGHDFWVKSNCEGHKDHLLIKMGDASFHHVKPGNKWNCDCPVCGGKLGNRNAINGNPWDYFDDPY
jgi:hypothetical protein